MPVSLGDPIAAASDFIRNRSVFAQSVATANRKVSSRSSGRVLNVSMRLSHRNGVNHIGLGCEL